VHYPLFKMVGHEGFPEYERCHQQRTTVVVAPLMLLEATTAAFSLHFEGGLEGGGLARWRPELD
jgi:hypothetical protein